MAIANPAPTARRYYFLAAGDEFELAKRAGRRGLAPGVFMDEVETRLLASGVEAERINWVKSTYITDDTESLAAKADERDIGRDSRVREEGHAVRQSLDARRPGAQDEAAEALADDRHARRS